MFETMDLTPEEKKKLKKKIVIGAAIFVTAYFGAKCGAKAALKDLKVDLNLISDGVKIPVTHLE